MNNVFFYTGLIISSFALTELIRRYSLKLNFLDQPNERSSHIVAIPRGGGLAIVVCFLLAVVIIDKSSSNITYVIMGAGILVSVIGLWDDYGHIAAKWRLLSHFVAVFWGLYWLGEIPTFQFLDFNINPNWFGSILIAIMMVWLLNLFNFMDGIDGIAASETIFVASAGAYFLWVNDSENITFISLALAASTIGFLILNWSPAKIFMGDVGSGFLGLMLGIIIYASLLNGMTLWVWLILLAVFLVDSGVTLLRRIFNREKWYEAHCSHAYQHAARKWGHKKVTISVVIVDLFWLFPLAIFSHFKPDFGLWITLLAFIPLIVVAFKLKAGITFN